MAKNLRFLSSLWTPGFYLLSLAVCALWLGNRLPFHNDLFVYVVPERTFNLESLRSGRIPLWNPYLSSGIPHLANWQSAFFYPPYWLLNFLGLPHGLIWLAFLHEALAFLGFFLWARSQKCPEWIAALGAISFAGSAHFIRCWINLPFICTASWIPWVFFSIERTLAERRLTTALWTIAVLSLQLLSGYPIFVFYTWIVLFLWLLAKRPSWPALGLISLLLAASLLLTTLQWLPFLEFLTYASRGDWNSFPYHTHPWEYTTLFHPTFLGVPGVSDYKGDPANSLFGNLYFGLIPCLIWLASLALKRARAGFWGLLSVFLLVWMAGPSLWKFLPEKIFDLLEPSKALGLFLFAACTSLARFLGAAGEVKRTSWVRVLGILWLLDLLILPYRLTYPVPDPYQNPALQRQAKELGEKAQGKILALQTSAQMSATGESINSEIQERMSRIFPDNFLPNTSMVWGLKTVTGYFSLQTENLKNMMHYINRGFPYNGGLLDVAGVRAFLLPQPLPGPQYRAAGKIGENFLTLNNLASGDLRWVTRAIEYPDRPSILNDLAQLGMNWAGAVYLERTPQGSWVRLPIAPRLLAPIPTRTEDGISGGRVSESVSSPQSCYWVLNESFAPGWHAWVDGRPTPILRAYGLFMAVEMEAGDHHLDFRYEPATFRLGLFMTLIALAVFSALSLKPLWRKK